MIIKYLILELRRFHSVLRIGSVDFSFGSDDVKDEGRDRSSGGIYGFGGRGGFHSFVN